MQPTSLTPSISDLPERPRVSSRSNMAIVIAILAFEAAVQAIFTVTHGLLRPPPGGVPGWVWVIAGVWLTVSMAVGVAATIRVGRVTRRGAVIAATGGVLAGLFVVGIRLLASLPA
jgi:hypothetical protein